MYMIFLIGRAFKIFKDITFTFALLNLIKLLRIRFTDDNPKFKNRIDYILNFIEQHPLANGAISFTRDEEAGFDLKLNYGIEQAGAFFIPAQQLFFSDILPQFESLAANQFVCNSDQLFAVEQQRNNPKEFIQDNRFQFDIIETIFFHISRFEEWYYLGDREDEHGRMDAKLQFLVKNQLHRRPVVDELIFSFLNAIGIKTDPVKTSYGITHDIDFIVKRNDFSGVMKSMAGAILKRGEFGAALKICQNRRLENPYDTFDWLLRKEEGVEKGIYFLMGGKSKFDNQYDLNLSIVQKAIQLSKERNYQIGIHPSYNTWKDEKLMQEEKEKLEAVIGEAIIFTRQHYLRFSFHHTPQIIDNLDVKEDSSLGYADLIGFRCGTGFSYQLYDFKNERPFNFIETPLIFMDSALLTEANNQPEKVEKIWTSFISENRFNTKITFNFHNSRFYDAALYSIKLKELYLMQFQK
jgi:Family of unknown function (DUF7033)